MDRTLFFGLSPIHRYSHLFYLFFYYLCVLGLFLSRFFAGTRILDFILHGGIFYRSITLSTNMCVFLVVTQLFMFTLGNTYTCPTKQTGNSRGEMAKPVFFVLF